MSGLNNFAVVDRVGQASLYRVAIPTSDVGWRTLAHVGVEAVCTLNGMSVPSNFKSLVLDVNTLRPLREQFEQAYQFIYQSIAQGQSCAFGCTRAIDRTGTEAGIWRLRFDRWPLKVVLEERNAFGVDLASDLMDHELVEIIGAVAAEEGLA